MRETARLVKHLNVTEDKRVESIRAQIERQLCPHDVKELRENATLRNTVAGQAASILQQINATGVSK
ncbi:MAG: hypothetical protein HC794_00760 [Nitrospiraceae bacterium]|nr:hypothetical protein [Nitrospiraceae bacterium]